MQNNLFFLGCLVQMVPINGCKEGGWYILVESSQLVRLEHTDTSTVLLYSMQNGIYTVQQLLLYVVDISDLYTCTISL